MLAITLPYVLYFLTILLYAVVAVVLIRKYLQNHDIGVVWLGIAVVAWPWVSAWIERGGRVLAVRTMNGHGVEFFPFSLISRGEISAGGFLLSLHSLLNVIGVSLLLVAVIYLCKRKSDTTP